MAGPSQREIQILMTMQDRVSAQFNAIASSADKAVAAIDRLSSTGANLNAAAAAAQKLATANAQAGASGQAAGNQIAAGANAASRAWTAAAAAAQQAATSAAKATQAANSSPGPNAGSIRGGAGSADAANAAAQAFRNAGAAAAKFASDATSSVSSVTRALAGIGSGVGSGLGGVFSVLSGGLSGLRTAAGGVGSVTSAIAGLGASTATLSTSAGHVNTFSTSISNMVALGASIVGFQGILGTLREAFGGLEEAVIGFNSLQERTQIAFTGIFGGGDEAAKKSQAFIAQLKQFAETTPFDFPELLKAAQGFLGVGLAAEKIIPLLREVAGAATAAGKSSADIAGISKGLQDIFSGGKIHAQDMNQLIQRGIPAWKILGESIQGAGESIDVAIGRARKLAEQGKLSANDFFNAFQAFGDKHNWEAILANAGTTFEGAMSNIRDSLRFLAGDAFQPLFQQISNVAQATETMLSSDAAKQWAADMAATVQEVINGFAPLKDAITNIFTGFQTGGVSGALAALVQEINSFGQSMFGAGWQLIQEFASGIIQGGAQLITDAANSVAQIIADFLIGNSPPPQGPLTAITDGGFALAQAYIDGVSGGFANFDTALTPIVDAFGNIGKNLDLSSASDAFKAAAGNIDAMKSAGTDVDNVLRGINDRLEAMKNAQQDVKDQISDVKSYYTDQIDSLQTVVDSIKDQNDYAARYADLIQKQNDAISQQADLQDKARNAELDAAKIAAEGDPVKRAQLIGQQQLIKSKEQELSLQQRAQQLDEQAAKADQEGQRYQERLNKYEQDRAAARKAGRPFTTLAPEAPNPKDQELARAKLELDRQQLALEQQLAGLQDKGKLAEIASQQAAIKTAADLRHAEEARAKAATEAITNAADIERAQRNIQALPFEQQIEGLKRAQKDALKPLEDQLTVMERQTELVDRQRQQWQGLKQDIAAAVSQQTALNTAAEKASKANAAANPTPNNLRSQPIDTSLVEAGKRAGTSFLTSFTDYLRDNWPKLVGGAIGAQVGGALFGPLGALGRWSLR
jgi:tape measure domain-containing protein